MCRGFPVVLQEIAKQEDTKVSVMCNRDLLFPVQNNRNGECRATLYSIFYEYESNSKPESQLYNRNLFFPERSGCFIDMQTFQINIPKVADYFIFSSIALSYLVLLTSLK